MSPTVTIKTIAQAVGVSPSTVSNAYNKPGQLSKDLRERILAIADELGYAGPDAAARTLRSGRAGSIGVLFTDRLSYAFSDPFAVGFLAGVAEESEKFGTSLLLMPVSNPDDEPAAAGVRQAAIDGAVVFCVDRGHPALATLRNRNIPSVTTDRFHGPEARWVAIDEAAAAASIGTHLAKLGHHDIVVMVDTNRPAGGQAEVMAFDEVGCEDCEARIRGLMTQLRLDGLTAGLPDARIRIVSGGHNAFASGRTAAELVLDTQDRPTAIVGLSDVLALGAMDAMRTRGLVPGRDITVTGFDDVPAAEAAGLTTVRQPIAEKGRLAARLLLDPDNTESQILLPTELIVRSSSGPAPRR
jgi:DNA-binding LacI/PurR family transcriptional regulator